MAIPIPALLAHPRVAAARRFLEEEDGSTVAVQRELSAIAAPTGDEGRRGARVAELLRDAGLAVETDSVGNIIGRAAEPPSQRAAEPPIIISAHLDTVFGPDVDVAVRGNGARIEGPGISDNARGLAVLVAVARALGAAGITTRRPITLVATVGEEGAGNLRGVRHLFGEEGRGKREGALPSSPFPRPFAFVALDGAGLTRVVHRALGSRRYRATYRGPGGHSWSAFGVANPANAVGRAVAALTAIPTHQAPRTTCSVVGLGGGTGLNSIPQEAWLDLDLRGEQADALARLDQAVQQALTAAANAENAARRVGTPRLRVDVAVVGNRPSGATAESHPLVQAALAATRALGAEPELASASTDANIPVSLGVPAVALGGGGAGGDAHLPSEWYENTQGALGPLRALLVLLAMAEVV